MMLLVFLVLLASAAYWASHLCYIGGLKQGYARGYDDGSKYWAKKYAVHIGRLNVALGSLSLPEIAQALKAPTTDKVYALFVELGKKGDKAVGDARAAAAEWVAK